MCPATLDQFLLTSYASFGKSKEAKYLRQFAIYAIVWCIWLECNSHIFNGRFSNKQVLWGKIRCLASLWCKAHNLFRGVSLLDMLRLEGSTLLIVFLLFVVVKRISCSSVFL